MYKLLIVRQTQYLFGKSTACQKIEVCQLKQLHMKFKTTSIINIRPDVWSLLGPVEPEAVRPLCRDQSKLSTLDCCQPQKFASKLHDTEVVEAVDWKKTGQE